MLFILAVGFKAEQKMYMKYRKIKHERLRILL